MLPPTVDDRIQDRSHPVSGPTRQASPYPTESELYPDASEDGTGAEDSGHGCPLCPFGSSNGSDVYVHLLASHRKSAITEALLEHER